MDSRSTQKIRLIQQQQYLKLLKEQKQIQSWKLISNEMNKIFPEKNRSGKQCRERYMNYVRFDHGIQKISGWTIQEDQQLFLKFMQYGAKWVQIGKQMEGRSENCLKNRFYGAMRKIIRKINRISKQKKFRQKKPIKTQLLIRILQFQCYQNKDHQIQFIQSLEFINQLKKQMIKIAINPQENSSFQDIQYIINGISKFCSITKSLAQKKGLIKKKQFCKNTHHYQIEKNDTIDSENIKSVEMGNEELKKDDENKTLTDKQQLSPKHKTIRNFILYSSQQLTDNDNNHHQKLFNIFNLFQMEPSESPALKRTSSQQSIDEIGDKIMN